MARPGADFDGKGGAFARVSFPVLTTGVTATTKQFVVNVCPDAMIEADETFGAALWNATGGYTISRNIGRGIIIDDDNPGAPDSRASVGEATIPEGDAGSRTLKFALTLSKPSTAPTYVTYVVRSGSASCGSTTAGVPTNPFSDCSNMGAQHTVTIPAGSVERTVPVTVFPDSAYEADEAFSVQLVGSAGASLDRASGTGTILNDDTVCNNGQLAPVQYKKVVVFAFENRTWAMVGGEGFNREVPYFHALAQSCSYFSSWTQTNLIEKSMTQYTGQVTGAFQPSLVSNCAPSASCSTTADNIFRQARVAGKRAINYVDGASTGCSAGSLGGSTAIAWVQTVPRMYMWGADQTTCADEVRPYSEFDPNNLPDFAFVTPTPCHNGHQIFTCGTNAAVSAWASVNVERVLQSEGYRRGEVAVFIWYDEDSPVPNMQIAPNARPGPFPTVGIGYGSTLKAWESMLGLPCLAGACSAPDMRTAGGF